MLMLAKHRKEVEFVGGENDCVTVEQIREHLLKYTDDRGTVGRDNDWGYGVIDVEDLILIGDDRAPIKKPVKPIPNPTPTPTPTPVEEEPVEPALPEPPEEPVEPEPIEPRPPKKQNDNKKWYIIGGVVAFLTLVGVFAVNSCQSEEESSRGYLEDGKNLRQQNEM